jgi:hypothetical protein
MNLTRNLPSATSGFLSVANGFDTFQTSSEGDFVLNLEESLNKIFLIVA